MRAARCFAAWLTVLSQAAVSWGQASGSEPRFKTVRRVGEEKRGVTPAAALHVMTWNVDHGTQVERIAAGMEKHRADLYLLQEVDWGTERAGQRDIAGELAERLGLAGAYAIEFEELSQERAGGAYTGQATLTTLALGRARALRFERQSGFWKPRSWLPSSLPLMQRRQGGRVALVTESRWGDRPLVVYNAHLESRSAGAIQEAQLQEMIEDARQYGPEAIIILGGDLNTKYWPGRFLRELEKAGFHSALGERVERTHKIAMALDWVFFKGPILVEAGAVERDVDSSDHYPVWTKIEPRP